MRAADRVAPRIDIGSPTRQKGHKWKLGVSAHDRQDQVTRRIGAQLQTLTSGPGMLLFLSCLLR
jgi:hypothetical protein